VSRRGAEAKPPWSSVPREIRDEAARILGAPIVRAERIYGGYAPSATFRMSLANGKRAFFKASYPLPKGSAVRWPTKDEERAYLRLGTLIRPWAPKFFGSFERDGWLVLLLEDLGPRSVPPWTPAKTRVAARSYARFHKSTLGKRLPRWLSRTQHADFGGYWDFLAKRRELRDVAALAKRRADEAAEWIDVALPMLRDLERGLARARPPFALLHFDTRSDNIRITKDRLRIFDWPYPSVGPAEFDVTAFAQSVVVEGGPEPERVLGWYEDVLPLRAGAVDASLAGISGYFADRARRPPAAGLPRIRAFQRQQLKSCLAWAARRFDLPEPRWLSAVAD
jgi:Phosphotransferase enzyme family